MDLHLPGSDYAQPHSALAGRRVLVTGGRGTLGQALCAGFASLGCEVWSVDQSPMHAGEHPAGLHQRVADVRDRASLEAVQADIAHTSGLDVLVNAHGLQLRTHFADCDEDTWMTLTDVNLNGVYRSCQVFGAPMRERGGAIVNMGSVNGVVTDCTKAPFNFRSSVVETRL